MDQILWIVFLLEWLTGVAVGWLIAYFYLRIGNSGATGSLPSGQERAYLSMPAAKGSDPTAAVLSALATERTAARASLNTRERELAETKTLLSIEKQDLARAREANLQAQTLLLQREEEISRVRASVVKAQAENATLAAAFEKEQRVAAESEEQARTLAQSKSDLSKAATQLQSDLRAANKSRQSTEQQLAELKQRLRTAVADLTAAYQNQVSMKDEIQARDQQVNDLLATVAQLQDDLKGYASLGKKTRRVSNKSTQAQRGGEPQEPGASSPSEASSPSGSRSQLVPQG